METHAKTTVSIDGLATDLSLLPKALYEDAIIRIGRHLYMNGTPLTVGAPDWSTFFPEEKAPKQVTTPQPEA